jgi:hypothetical protein
MSRVAPKQVVSDGLSFVTPTPFLVTPAEAGVQETGYVDARLRGHDEGRGGHDGRIVHPMPGQLPGRGGAPPGPPPGLLTICLASLCIMLLLVAGCDSPPPVEELTADQILERSADEMSGLQSLRFRLEVLNGTMPLGQGIAVSRIDGDAVAPDRLRMDVRARFGNQPVELESVVLGQRQYLTNPLNQQWQEVSGALSAPSILHPERGLGAALRRVEGAQRLGRESVDGADSYHLRGTVPAEVLADLVGSGESVDSPVDVELWVDSREFLLRRAKLVGAIVPGESEFLERELYLSGFNQAATIEAPIP